MSETPTALELAQQLLTDIQAHNGHEGAPVEMNTVRGSWEDVEPRLVAVIAALEKEVEPDYKVWLNAFSCVGQKPEFLQQVGKDLVANLLAMEKGASGEPFRTMTAKVVCS